MISLYLFMDKVRVLLFIYCTIKINDNNYIMKKTFFQLFEPQRWYVFGMKMGIPYLEYYDKEESAFSGEPIHSFCMANCKRITYTMGRLNKVWTFCIFLEDRILELTADNRYWFLSISSLWNSVNIFYLELSLFGIFASQGFLILCLL